MDEKQIEKKMSDFYQSFYYIFGWILLDMLGFSFFYNRGRIDEASGFILGSLLSITALFIMGWFEEFQRIYIKKTGKIF
jgi:hypothetical protein